MNSESMVKNIPPAISSTSKSAQIETFFKENESFTNGNVVIANVAASSNSDVLQVMFVQKRTVSRSGANNPLLALTMQWENSRILRVWQNITKDLYKGLAAQFEDGVVGIQAEAFFNAIVVIEKRGLYTGQELTLSVQERTVPITWMDSNDVQHVQSPVVNPSNGNPLLHAGKPFYSNTVLGVAEETEDIILPVDNA